MALGQTKVYVSVDFQVRRGMADEAGGILISCGALGCEVSKISPHAHTTHAIHKSTLLRAYFARITPARLKRLEETLRAANMLAESATAEPQLLKDPGWATMWQARFAPLPIGRNFLVVPPWQRLHDPDRIRLVIRPGQAFGTGHHPSTSGTLSVLEEISNNRTISHALDVGTGSGILAIAMVKLGVARVIALDIDQAAIKNAKENAKLNRVGARIRFSTTPLDLLRGRFELIAANILGSTLIRLAPDLKRRLRRRGYLVLAGILRREAASVIDAYLPELTFQDARHFRTWTTLILRK